MADLSEEGPNSRRSRHFFETTAAQRSWLDVVGISLCEKFVAEREGESSNSLFEVLEDWEAQLQAQNIDFEELSP